MKSNKIMKTLALSITMALVMMTGDLCAQYRDNQYGIQPWFETGMMGRQGSKDGSSVSAEDFNLPSLHGSATDQSLPLGSGTLLLLGLGAAYLVGKRRKED